MGFVSPRFGNFNSKFMDKKQELEALFKNHRGVGSCYTIQRILDGHPCRLSFRLLAGCKVLEIGHGLLHIAPVAVLSACPRLGNMKYVESGAVNVKEADILLPSPAADHDLKVYTYCHLVAMLFEEGGSHV